MTTNQIAARLVELCRHGKYEEAQKELFADDAVSIEPYAMPPFEKETKGLPGIFEKGRQFESIVEAMHGTTVSDPIVAGNVIAFALNMDATMKGRERSVMTELCVYHVKDGKIVSEQFFM